MGSISVGHVVRFSNGPVRESEWQSQSNLRIPCPLSPLRTHSVGGSSPSSKPNSDLITRPKSDSKWSRPGWRRPSRRRWRPRPPMSGRLPMPRPGWPTRIERGLAFAAEGQARQSAQVAEGDGGKAASVREKQLQPKIGHVSRLRSLPGWLRKPGPVQLDWLVPSAPRSWLKPPKLRPLPPKPSLPPKRQRPEERRPSGNGSSTQTSMPER